MELVSNKDKKAIKKIVAEYYGITKNVWRTYSKEYIDVYANYVCVMMYYAGVDAFSLMMDLGVTAKSFNKILEEIDNLNKDEIKETIELIQRASVTNG